MTKGKLTKVVFEPDGAEIRVPAGTLLSKAAAAVGRMVETPCGGMGTCGKCRVIVHGEVSPPESGELRLISEADRAAGVRLACRTKILGETYVTIPEESLSRVQRILKDSSLRDCNLASGISKFYLQLTPPSLADETAEFERLSRSLKQVGVEPTAGIDVIRGISKSFREADYEVTAVLHGHEIIGIEPGDTVKHSCGIAFDLGSTTVVGYLIDLNTGNELAVSAVMNPQAVYGDDLVSRISFATTHDNGLETLRSAAMDALNRITASLLKHAKVAPEHVYRVTLVGNTCMTHIIMGIDVSSLGQSPYVPSVCAGQVLSAREFGLSINPGAKIHILPNVAGFVGSDLVGVLLSNMWEYHGKTRLAVDIGTNGEMAVSHNGRLLVCSAAAGPAFEGAGISCGMRGAPGAIDSVVIDDVVRFTVIDNRKPVGLCGSGLVDAVAQMLDAGIVDETGRLQCANDCPGLSDAVKERLIETEKGVEFVLANRRESGTGKPITLTAADIRHLQLAKGSIHAAIQTLLGIAGCSESDMCEVMLAGAFGNYISVESAIRIGLVPLVDRKIVSSIGNAAGAGARLALLSEQEMERVRDLAHKAEHIELAVSPEYQMNLMDKMMFPSQDEFQR